MFDVHAAQFIKKCNLAACYLQKKIRKASFGGTFKVLKDDDLLVL